MLERRNRQNEEINVETNSEEETGLLLQTARPFPSEEEEETEPEEERPIETSPIMEFEAPAPQTTTKATELKLNQPKPFRGKDMRLTTSYRTLPCILKLTMKFTIPIRRKSVHIDIHE